MTSLHLLLWIAGGIFLQIAIYLGLGFARHWQQFQSLKSTLVELDLPVQSTGLVDAPANSTAAWAGLRNFRVERKVSEDAAQQICSFYLVPEDGKPLPEFLPGQFLTFKLNAPDAGVNAVIRCYSLSDAPQSSAYRVSIKRAPAPAGSSFAPGISSNYFHDHVAVGSVLQLRAPSGHFHIDRAQSPVVLIGGGIGITPMLSMLNWSLNAQPGREVWLFYGVRHADELVMRAHLEALAAKHPNFHLHFCLSDAQALGAYQHNSRVDVELLRRLLPLKPYHFYICGPTPMLASLVPGLEDWGVPDAHIHFEAFGPASILRKKRPNSEVPLATQGTGAVMVHFAKSGKQLPWQPGMGSLLEFAEANGIAIDSGCRSGGCGTCQTTIQSGEVAYTQSPDCDPEPGSCLLCVCTPKTAVTLEA